MRIFVISMKGATERRNAAARQMNEAALDFEFFDAVERVSDAFRHFDGFSRRLYKLNTGRPPLPGEIACYASHKTLWKLCTKLNEPIVVLEDDFELAHDFASVVVDVESWIEAFGFIRLQSYERSRANTGVGPVRYLANVPLCLLAYAISPAAAASLSRSSGILGAPVDKFLQKTWQHATPIFALEDPIVSPSELAEESMIGDRQKKCRHASFVVQRMLYKGMNALRRSHFNYLQRKRLEIEGFAPHVRLRMSTRTHR